MSKIENTFSWSSDKKEVGGLEAQVSANKNDITQLKSTTQTNTSDITNLKSTTQTNTSDITNLKSTTQTNTNDITQLKSSSQIQTNDIIQLKSAVQDIDRNYLTVDGQYTLNKNDNIVDTFRIGNERSNVEIQSGFPCIFFQDDTNSFLTMGIDGVVVFQEMDVKKPISYSTDISDNITDDRNIVNKKYVDNKTDWVELSYTQNTTANQYSNMINNFANYKEIMFVGYFTDFTMDTGTWMRLPCNIVGVNNLYVDAIFNLYKWDTTELLGMVLINSNGEIIHKSTDGRSIIKRYFHGMIYGR